MNGECTIRRVAGIMAAPVDGELVFLSSSSDAYVAIDAVGRQIWERLESPVRFGELVDSLGREFAGTRARIETDLALFLRQLQADGIVEVFDAGTP